MERPRPLPSARRRFVQWSAMFSPPNPARSFGAKFWTSSRNRWMPPDEFELKTAEAKSVQKRAICAGIQPRIPITAGRFPLTISSATCLPADGLIGTLAALRDQKPAHA